MANDMIQTGNIMKCNICGDTPNTPTHVCKWESEYEESKMDSKVHVSWVRQLLLDSYYRGRNDGMSNLTQKQTLDLQNASNQLEDTVELIHKILHPKKPE